MSDPDGVIDWMALPAWRCALIAEDYAAAWKRLAELGTEATHITLPFGLVMRLLESVKREAGIE